MNSNVARCLALCWVGCSLVMLGCGSGENLERAAVSGTVTLDGKPLEFGTIRFIPTGDAKGPKTSVTITFGEFSADAANGPLVGVHRIEIESTDDGGYGMDDEAALEELEASGQKEITVVTVPAIYNLKSKLTETVSASGPNEFTFELKTPR